MLIDPQRNLLTTLLVGALAVLGVSAIAVVLLFGRADAGRSGGGEIGGVEDIRVDVPETGLEEFERYSAIMERPVFFSDRRLPVVEIADDGEIEEAAPLDEVEDVPALKASIAGIVITPEMKLAMISDEAVGRTVVLREGMSLEGDQAAWRLESILPRGVSFVSVDGRTTDLELKVHTSGLSVGTPAPTRRAGQAERERPAEEAENGNGETEAADEISDEARARAEEIRRRVAERRAELRAEAERRARQQQQDN